MIEDSKMTPEQIRRSRRDTVQYINLQLASLGEPTYQDDENSELKFCNPKFENLTNGLIKSFREKSRLLARHFSPVDLRIQNFINEYLKDIFTIQKIQYKDLSETKSTKVISVFCYIKLMSWNLLFVWFLPPHETVKTQQ